jgi:hypothetical protein
VREATDVVIEVARVPDGRSAQYWQARLTPLPRSEAGTDIVVLIALRDITSETRVQRLKASRG